MAEKPTKFLKKYQDKLKAMAVTAEDFQNVWEKFDEDHNGYIEGKEIETFLRVLLQGESFSDSLLADLEREILEAYDSNCDNRIEQSELAEMLEPEQNFLLLFRVADVIKSSVDFMEVWRKYDKDKSGYIETEELEEFLKDNLKKNASPIVDDTVKEYAKKLISIYDANHDGKLELKEMAKLLPAKENFLKRFEGPLMPNRADKKYLSREDFEKVFQFYDKDNNGTIEGDELNGFLKDLMEHEGNDKKYSDEELTELSQILFKLFDEDGDGTLDKSELKLLFCPEYQSKHE